MKGIKLGILKFEGGLPQTFARLLLHIRGSHGTPKVKCGVFTKRIFPLPRAYPVKVTLPDWPANFENKKRT